MQPTDFFNPSAVKEECAYELAIKHISEEATHASGVWCFIDEDEYTDSGKKDMATAYEFLHCLKETYGEDTFRFLLTVYTDFPEFGSLIRAVAYPKNHFVADEY